MSRPYLTIPMPDARPVYLVIDWPIDDDQWQHLIDVLDAMRPGVTVPLCTECDSYHYPPPVGEHAEPEETTP